MDNIPMDFFGANDNSSPALKRRYVFLTQHWENTEGIPENRSLENLVVDSFFAHDRRRGIRAISTPGNSLLRLDMISSQWESTWVSR